ncbi:hypothetical protein PANDA_013412 [Ailuropoda melanoleuca]|uniref:Uncharacterized protein n=1 Tax=Ailuropoda melanoleuca TaxID=9646 RepID=D2HNV6_AILME|nr:hypothetical protein PANDA_013412 [Ailuropoda melanoleuca]
MIFIMEVSCIQYQYLVRTSHQPPPDCKGRGSTVLSYALKAKRIGQAVSSMSPVFGSELGPFYRDHACLSILDCQPCDKQQVHLSREEKGNTMEKIEPWDRLQREKCRGKRAAAEDRNEPKIEPDTKKSKTGAKRNGKEAAGEPPVLSKDPSPPDQKTSPSVFLRKAPELRGALRLRTVAQSEVRLQRHPPPPASPPPHRFVPSPRPHRVVPSPEPTPRGPLLIGKSAALEAPRLLELHNVLNSKGILMGSYRSLATVC